MGPHADAVMLTLSSGVPCRSSFFSLFGSKEEEPEVPSLPEGDCPKLRPAQLPRASCPAVGAEMEIRRREGLGKDNGGCAAQPPACCEAARRAEAAAKMVQDQIRGNPFLRWMQMQQIPAALLLLPSDVTTVRLKARCKRDFL
ncbi:unnamed protein product [Durusdinium trenchii]|uniref:Uncharacterized protein n=1 Tax=Durusdinium trenchii TaxID=1381693 RepID=A0ABP0MCG5_9DINO